MHTAEDIVKDKNRRIVSISNNETVQKACQKMVENKIGAILVKKNDEFIGIWTERDLLHLMNSKGFDPKKARVEDYMTTPLHTVSHNARLHKMEDMFLGLFVRHLLVKKEGKTIGLISIGDVLRAGLLERERQFKECNYAVTWDYYENWKWDRKKSEGV